MEKMEQKISCGKLHNYASEDHLMNFFELLKITPGCKVIVVQRNCSSCKKEKGNLCSVASINIKI